ncbi:hypothetical protein [Changchengzhania lutea]|uniref:hypothetical protein n=1 Tax=Changchengzhania lutea TaxID=2049305 RepID=UPI00115D6F60|nr:hypothetical protein [Changchengzhania lutea]
MQPFRSEIRNSPSAQTIKVFLSDETLDKPIKKHLEGFDDAIDFIEIRESVERNRADEHLTVFVKEDANIGALQAAIEEELHAYFKME